MGARQTTEGIGRNMLLGALAGTVGTLAMTAAMRRMHERLPSSERYPLPPREITETVFRNGEMDVPEEALRDASLAAHFAYGALTGALFGLLRSATSAPLGTAYGAGIWAASYFGWVPAVRILRPANEHPSRRNRLMVAAHIVWGAVTAWSIGELRAARSTILRKGPLRDRAPGGPDLPASLH